MTKAKKCPRCGVITTSDCCTVRLSAHGEACGGITKPVRDYNLGCKLSVDVTFTLRFDHDRQPFLLVQKPSGQERITLAGHDATLLNEMVTGSVLASPLTALRKPHN